MSKWYYSVDGCAQGPVEDAVIMSNLKSGKLTLVDLVFREGDDGWRTIGEVPQFKDAYVKTNLPSPVVPSSPNAPLDTPSGASTPRRGLGSTESAAREAAPFVKPHVTGDGKFTFQPNPELMWVLLTRSTDRGEDRFHQSGPYSSAQIEGMLARGECEYSDYAWRPGYRKWVRIGNLPEFDRRRKSRDGDRVPETVPLPEVEITTPAGRQEFMESLMRTPPAAPAAPPETAPPETDGKDFAEITAPQFDVEAAQRELEARITAAQKELEAKVSAASLGGQPPKSAPPPVEKREPPIDPMEIDPPPSVPDSPFPAGVDSVKTVIYGGGAAASQDDGKTMVYARPPGADPMAPPPLDEPQSMSAAPAAKFDPDATMVQMGGSSRSPQETVVQGESLFVEEVPVGLKRFRKPLAASVASAALIIAVLQIFDLKPFRLNVENPPGSAVDPIQIENPNKNARAPEAPAAPEPEPEVVKQDPAPTREPVAVASPPPTATPAPPENPGVDVSGLRAVPPGTGKVTVLDLVPVRTDGVRTQFAVNTNAAIGSTIYISLLARSGEVLKHPSFYTTASVTRSSDEIPTFDFTNLRLPVGQYRVEVAAGDMRRARAVFIGARNSDFEAALERHLKDISHQQQTEKKALFHSARLLEGLAKTLGENYFESRTDARKWRTFYINWQKDVAKTRKLLVDRVAPERRNELAYPDEIIALKIATTKLIEQADALNDSILSNTQARDVAGAGNLAIVKEFARIRALAATISSRKS